MSIELRGDFDLNQFAGRVNAAVPHAVRAGLEHVGEVSAQQTPLEEGTLVRSQKIRTEGNEGVIGYHTVYARYQHERLDLRHPHGNAKYLEGPMLTEKDQVLRIMAKRLREEL